MEKPVPKDLKRMREVGGSCSTGIECAKVQYHQLLG